MPYFLHIFSINARYKICHYFSFIATLRLKVKVLVKGKNNKTYIKKAKLNNKVMLIVSKKLWSMLVDNQQLGNKSVWTESKPRCQ